MKKMIAADTSNEHIGPAIVIVIADSHAHAVKGEGQSGLCRDVLERTVPLVAVQDQGGRWMLPVLMTRPEARIHEQNVLTAVPVVVEEGNSRPHGLREQLLAEDPVGMPEADAGSLGNVGEAYRGNRHRWPVSCRRRAVVSGRSCEPHAHGE